MKFESLVELYNSCRFNPHYQYRDVSEEAFLKNAAISFKRIKDLSKKNKFLRVGQRS